MMKRSFQTTDLLDTPDKTGPKGVALAVSSVALVAATYGMARFGVGLLHPQMAAARPDLEGALRPAGAAQFASYCVAVVIGGQLAQTKARAVAAAAGLSAAMGCLGLLVAQTPLMFTIAAFIAGTGAGLASPALVPLLDRAVPTRLAGPAQTAVNSGTALGLMVSGSLVLITTDIVMPWLLIASICVVAGGAAWFFAPDHAPSARSAALMLGRRQWAPLIVPLSLSLVVGAVSAYVWTYGPSVIIEKDLISTDNIGWLWLTVGTAGLFGVVTSRLVDRIGPLGAFLLSSASIILATAGISLTATPWVAIASLAVFGASYMVMSGILILWGRILRPDNGGQATAWLFLALAVGQAVGAVTIGSP